jgi:hypothetical protein
MATSTITAAGALVSHEDKIYRALNPKHFEDGLPGDNHFVMKQNHAAGDGVSTGIASLISVPQLRSIEVIRQTYGDDFGVAELAVSEVLAPVATLGISVIQQTAAEWGVFAEAHAVITGYQVLTGREGKRKIHDFQRHLVKLARRRYYPIGIESPVSAD